MPTTPKAPDRRTVQLAVLAEVEVPPEPPPAAAVVPERTPGHFSVPTSRDDWLRLAEHVVGDWTATLRAALMLLLLFAGMVTTIGIMFGLGSAAAATAVGLLVFLAGRRRDSTPPE